MIAATGMVAQQTRVDVIANNLANMNTTGYQKSRASFHDLVYQNQNRPNSTKSRASGIVPSGVKAGHGVRIADAYRIAEQGSLRQTGNALDLAIEGRGYFQVTLPNGGTAYTRAGAFQLDQGGQLVTADGLAVGGIAVPANAIDVSVNRSGEVLASLPGTALPANIGQLQLVRFPNEGALRAIGDNLYQETPSSGPAAAGIADTPGYGSVLQGFIETSNVNPVEEITSLIQAMRAYELNSKVIQTADQMMATNPSR
ncbi:MAG: flagellar basal-body rod protein FlgG [Rhodospirillaceae bacterium]